MKNLTQKDIEKLIEEKVEERTSNLKQKIKEQQKEIESLKKYSKANQRNNNRKERISRRSFLKKLGAGAVGLGALSLSPVSSSMKITSDNIYKDGTAIDQGGIFDLQNYLKLDGTNSMTGDLTPNKRKHSATRREPIQLRRR